MHVCCASSVGNGVQSTVSAIMHSVKAEHHNLGTSTVKHITHFLKHLNVNFSKSWDT